MWLQIVFASGCGATVPGQVNGRPLQCQTVLAAGETAPRQTEDAIGRECAENGDTGRGGIFQADRRMQESLFRRFGGQ